MKKIFSEIITIGDEILYGHILDSNAQWLSQELDKIGIITRKRVTIGDNEKDILKVLKESLIDNNLILITGGLGPTNDDITKNCFVKFFKTSLVLNNEALLEIKKLFKERNLKLTEKNKSQAFLPKCAKKINNLYGTAPGMWFEKDEKVIISMPGVPYEMKEMMKKDCIKMIKNFFNTPVIFHKTIKTIGIGESWLSDLVQNWEKKMNKNIDLAYLPSIGQVKLRLTAKGNNKMYLEKIVDEEIRKILPTIRKYVYGFDDEKIEESIAKLLINNNKTIAVAESCSGGLVSHMLTSIDGSSNYFIGSIISYNDKIKTEELSIPTNILNKKGAVSEEVVKIMAQNIRIKYKASIGIASSGIAGPTGGTKEKPVGTIWIAYSDSKKTMTKKLKLTKKRSLNVQLTAINLLNMIRLNIIETQQLSL